jgi:hypothetical protein
LCPIIASIEDLSPASLKSTLVPGLRVLRVNRFQVEQNDSRALDTISKALLQVQGENIEIEFLEPKVVINKYSYGLDVDIEGQEFNVHLPIGAVNNPYVFEKAMMASLASTHKILKFINVSVDKKTYQTSFSSEHFEFRLLFKSGKNSQKSCKYALAFLPEDTGKKFVHTGEPMVIDLALGLPEEQFKILMTELFETFDLDGNGKFEYEEFRDFYLKFMDKAESRELLKKYAVYRFRDQEKEKMMEILRREAELAKQRAIELRERNRKTREAQRAKFYATSVVGADGVRRKIKVPKESQMKKTVTFAEGEHPDDNKSLADILKSEDEEEQLRREKREQEEAKKLAQKNAELKKHKQAVKEARRRQIEEDNKNAMLSNKLAQFHMGDVVNVLQRTLKHSIKVLVGEDGIQRIQVCQTDVTTPALRVPTSAFTGSLTADEVGLDVLPSSMMHPAGRNYFFRKHREHEIFNPNVCHPAFFNSDYERFSTRHALNAFSICKEMTVERNDGYDYRKERKLEFLGDRIDPVDTPPPPLPPPPPPLVPHANTLIGYGNCKELHYLHPNRSFIIFLVE